MAEIGLSSQAAGCVEIKRTKAKKISFTRVSEDLVRKFNINYLAQKLIENNELWIFLMQADTVDHRNP